MRNTRAQAHLVKEYAAHRQIPLRTAQYRRKAGHQDWVEWINAKAVSGSDGASNPLTVEKFGDLQTMLRRMEQTETTAAAMVRRAEDQNDLGALPVLAKHHADACANLTRVRKELLVLQQQEKELITIDEVRETMRRFIVPIRTELANLPRSWAIECNPSDAPTAEEALTRWVERIIQLLNEADKVGTPDAG